MVPQGEPDSDETFDADQREMLSDDKNDCEAEPAACLAKNILRILLGKTHNAQDVRDRYQTVHRAKTHWNHVGRRSQTGKFVKSFKYQRVAEE